MHYSAKSEILIKKLNEWYEEESSPPMRDDIYDVEPVAVVFIEEKRWGTLYEWIYKLGDDEVYAAVADVEPATEMQDWGDYGEPSIYPVEAYQVTVTKYRKVALPEEG